MPIDPTKNDNLENLQHLQHLFISKRVPASGSINLTNRCNLNCVHCYLGNRNSEIRSSKNELNTQQWFSIIDEITKAGCLSLLLTGGEVLLRPDFEAIYKKAVCEGMLVTVFTNGTLINKRVLSLFEDYPPRSVEISLYGATPKTYEAITRLKGSYAHCLKGIQELYKKKIRFNLKTMMLTHNQHEWNDINNIAKEFGVNFRMDPAISPCLDGSRTPLDCRVDPAIAVRADFADPDRTSRWLDYYKKIDKFYPANENLYNCGAGLTNFHIDPAGTLVPCIMLTRPAFELTKGSFMDGWQNEISKLRELKIGDEYKCNSCEKRGLCGSCPAFFELENGSPEKHSQYLCNLADNRLQAITANLPVEEITNK